MPHPKWGTPEWIQEQEESRRSVKNYFTNVIGPYDPNAPSTVNVYINPKSGLLENIPPEDQQPIEDTTGLFQKRNNH